MLTGRNDDADDGVSIVIWGAAENAITIMAASVPMLRVLAVRRWRSDGPRRNHRGGKGSSTSTTQVSGRPLLSTSASGRWFFNKPRRDLASVNVTANSWMERTRE
jgi:hypothetical protein